MVMHKERRQVDQVTFRVTIKSSMKKEEEWKQYVMYIVLIVFSLQSRILCTNMLCYVIHI